MQAFQTELLTSVLKTTSLHQTNDSNTLSLHTQAQYSVQLPRPDASNPGIYLGLVWAEFETQASVYHLTIHWFIHLTSFDSEQRTMQEIRLSNTNRPVLARASHGGAHLYGPQVQALSTGISDPTLTLPNPEFWPCVTAWPLWILAFFSVGRLLISSQSYHNEQVSQPILRPNPSRRQSLPWMSTHSQLLSMSRSQRKLCYPSLVGSAACGVVCCSPPLQLTGSYSSVYAYTQQAE